MEDDLSLTPFSHLCRIINNTFATNSVTLLPWQAGHLLATTSELSCDKLVEFVLPRALVLLSLAVLLFAYYAYYRRYVVSVPRVVCADEKRLKALKKHCPAFFEEFWPTVWAPQTHMQTVIRVAIQTFPKSKRKR